ncbi:MAG: protein-disulfide reductase DsbD [Candidatus Omnitrophota bacterium]
MKNNILALTLFFISIIPFSAYAQNAEQDKLFAWNASLSQAQAAQGSSITINLDAVIAPDHIIYHDSLKIAAETPVGSAAFAPVYPQPETKIDPIDGAMKAVYHGTVRFQVPIQLAANAPLGEMKFNVSAHFQGCSPTICYFPRTKKIELTLAVVKGTDSAIPAAAQVQTPAPPPASGNNIIENQLSQGFFWALLSLFFAGFLTSLTPCVFPLIPITVSIFGAKDAESRWKAFSLSSVYVLGIVTMYSSLGFAAARTGALFGQFMSNPWAVVPIALFFMAMGASMLGAFELQLPSALQNRLSRAGGRGYPSAFLMGLAAGVIAAPCTGPVLFPLLLFAAKQGNAALGFSLLFVYALGLGSLFLIVGTFSGLISKLPKSGRWMEGVKSFFGIVLFAFALYFLKDAFPFLRPPWEATAMAYIAVGALFVVGTVLGAFHLSFHSPNKITRLKKSAGVLLCVLTIYFAAAAPRSALKSQVPWITNLNQGLADAKAQGKPVMIDFFAEWCTACKEIDAYTYTNPQVGEALRRFVNIKADMTYENEDDVLLKQKYEIAGLPLIVFYDSKGNLMANKRITGFVDAENFLKLIADIP